MLAGMWMHHQLSDGTYDLYDLCEVHRVLDWREEQEALLRESRKQ